MKCLANRPGPINVSFFKIRHLHWRKPRNSNESSGCSQPGRPDCSHLIPANKKRVVLCCGSWDENTARLNCNFILLPLYHSALILKSAILGGLPVVFSRPINKVPIFLFCFS